MTEFGFGHQPLDSNTVAGTLIHLDGVILGNVYRLMIVRQQVHSLRNISLTVISVIVTFFAMQQRGVW